MLTESTLRERRRRLADLLDSNDLDWAAIVPGANFYYLTGVNFHLMERPTVLFVSADGSLAAVIPELEKGKWSAEGPDCETVYWQDSDGYDDSFAKAAKLVSARKIGVEGQRMRVFEGNALKEHFGNVMQVDANDVMSETRIAKDPAEIELMQKAVDISERALLQTIETAQAGMSEGAMVRILKAAMLEHGAEGFAFDPIVLAGGMSADPHGSPSNDRQIKPGDPLLIDFGASYGGYHADITRTFFCQSVTDEHRAIYETVLAANTKGREIANDQLTASDLDEGVTEVLRQSSFADMILHKTGHGLGLDVHEAPQIMIGNGRQLAPGMVVTIEPGLYRPGDIGVRIEDDVLIEAGGCRSLTSFSRDLRLIGD